MSSWKSETRREELEVRRPNHKGTFKLGGVPTGTYKFKVTMNGFQSVVGDIVVSKKANKSDQLKLVMKLGE